MRTLPIMISILAMAGCANTLKIQKIDTKYDGEYQGVIFELPSTRVDTTLTYRLVSCDYKVSLVDNELVEEFKADIRISSTLVTATVPDPSSRFLFDYLSLDKVGYNGETEIELSRGGWIKSLGSGVKNNTADILTGSINAIGTAVGTVVGAVIGTRSLGPIASITSGSGTPKTLLHQSGWDAAAKSELVKQKLKNPCESGAGGQLILLKDAEDNLESAADALEKATANMQRAIEAQIGTTTDEYLKLYKKLIEAESDYKTKKDRVSGLRSSLTLQKKRSFWPSSQKDHTTVKPPEKALKNWFVETPNFGQHFDQLIAQNTVTLHYAQPTVSLGNCVGDKGVPYRIPAKGKAWIESNGTGKEISSSAVNVLQTGVCGYLPLKTRGFRGAKLSFSANKHGEIRTVKYSTTSDPEKVAKAFQTIADQGKSIYEIFESKRKTDLDKMKEQLELLQTQNSINEIQAINSDDYWARKKEIEELKQILELAETEDKLAGLTPEELEKEKELLALEVEVLKLKKEKEELTK